MNYNQSIVKNLLKSTLESECLRLLSELKLVHSADRLFLLGSLFWCIWATRASVLRVHVCETLMYFTCTLR